MGCYRVLQVIPWTPGQRAIFHGLCRPAAGLGLFLNQGRLGHLRTPKRGPSNPYLWCFRDQGASVHCQRRLAERLDGASVRQKSEKKKDKDKDRMRIRIIIRRRSRMRVIRMTRSRRLGFDDRRRKQDEKKKKPK